MVNIAINVLISVEVSLSMCACQLLFLSSPPTFIHSLYLNLIANAGSIATAIDLSAETPSRQEK